MTTLKKLFYQFQFSLFLFEEFLCLVKSRCLLFSNFLLVSIFFLQPKISKGLKASCQMLFTRYYALYFCSTYIG